MERPVTDIETLVRNTIAALESIKTTYATEDTNDIPEALSRFNSAIPVATKALVAIAGNGDKLYQGKETNSAVANEQQPIAQNIQAKATKLTRIFEAVIPPADSSRADRYHKEDRNQNVKRLMEELLGGIIRLAEVRKVEEDIIDDLKDELDNISAMPASSHDGTSYSIQNYGPGDQLTHLGRGDQNLNRDPGTQINGRPAVTIHHSKPE